MCPLETCLAQSPPVFGVVQQGYNKPCFPVLCAADVKPENVMLAREVLGGGTPATTDGKVWRLITVNSRAVPCSCRLEASCLCVRAGS